MNAIEITCPHCNDKALVSQEDLGYTIDCPACGESFKAPRIAKRSVQSEPEEVIPTAEAEKGPAMIEPDKSEKTTSLAESSHGQNGMNTSLFVEEKKGGSDNASPISGDQACRNRSGRDDMQGSLQESRRGQGPLPDSRTGESEPVTDADNLDPKQKKTRPFAWPNLALAFFFVFIVPIIFKQIQKAQNRPPSPRFSEGSAYLDPAGSATSNDTKIVKSLLDMQSNADEQLLEAIFEHDLSKAKSALAVGANVNMTPLGIRPILFDCIEKDQTIFARLLIENGADLNLRTRFGRTPLHEVAVYGRLEIARLLIEHGADVNAKNPRGQTPLDYTSVDLSNSFGPKRSPERDAVGSLLRRHGGLTGESVDKTVTPAGATEGAYAANGKTRGFTNSLGMKMVPVPGTGVLFCEHETRVQDYAAYAAANSGVDQEWKDYEHEGHKQASDHPVVNVSWKDAKAFCAWLSKKEGKEYRLPTDHEWSVAVGIGDKENAAASPKEKSWKFKGIYPWGTVFPPPQGAGNFSGQESATQHKIEGYRDDHAFTAPVKSYKANEHGLYDLGGNVCEWCEDWYSTEQKYRVLRGGSWFHNPEYVFRSSFRFDALSSRIEFFGFRVVVVGVGG